MPDTKTFEVYLLKDGPENRTIFVLGATGVGKTTLIATILRDAERFVIIDAKNDYDAEYFGKETVIIFSVEDLVKSLNEGIERIIFKIQSHRQEADSIVESALQVIYEFQVANRETDLPPLVVSLDELNRFVESSNCPFALKEMIERGRDFRVQKIFGAQWFNSIPTWVRNSFSEIYAFRHADKNGLNMLSSFGADPEIVKNLPAYHCLHVGKKGVEVLNLVPKNRGTKTPHTNKTNPVSAEQK